MSKTQTYNWGRNKFSLKSANGYVPSKVYDSYPDQEQWDLDNIADKMYTGKEQVAAEKIYKNI